MLVTRKELISEKAIVEFTVPRLHIGRSWYVDFFAFDPSLGKMRRKKYMLNHYHQQRQKRDIASILIHNLYEKLKAGWNPFINGRKTRQFTDFESVVQRYVEYTLIAEKKEIIKPKTGIDYRSRMKQLQEYMQESGNKIGYIYQFDRIFAVDFLDYLIYDKDVSAKTRNNYRTWLSTFGTWLTDRQYIDINPIEGIHLMREKEKNRDAIPVGQLRRLREYLVNRTPPFYLACMMEYYTFIRPGELRYIKIGDISIKDQTIYVSSDVSKNRKGQVVAISDALLKMMISQHVFDHPSQDYLFGKDIFPGPEQIYINQFRKEWIKVRKALDFPDSYQFYSLKDSGIRDLANAKGIVVARDQARHSDISITNKYLKREQSANEVTKHFKGEL
jgi:integrase